MKVYPFPHQLHEVYFMLRQNNGLQQGDILGDHMSLGKTMTTITALCACVDNGVHAHLIKSNHIGPKLVLLPKGLIPHWTGEFAKAIPSGCDNILGLSLLLAHGDVKKRTINDLEHTHIHKLQDRVNVLTPQIRDVRLW
ncbi:hypothetical protein FQN50_005567 [Emmonsiellopsis sp. PD_5]|nr:hypothetical protein FQN50_005567 [Emmonsiellopsis sp. PD_5]